MLHKPILPLSAFAIAIGWVAFSPAAPPETDRGAQQQNEGEQNSSADALRRKASLRAYGFGWPDLPVVDRDLRLHELDELLWASQVIVDRFSHDVDSRMVAHTHIDKIHHVYGLPALLAVVVDRGDHPNLRSSIVRSLSTYPARYTVAILVSLLNDAEHEVAETANRALYYVSGLPFQKSELSIPERIEDRQAVLQQWQAWWETEQRQSRSAGGGYGGGGYGGTVNSSPPAEAQ